MKTRHLLIAALLAGVFAPALAWQSGGALDIEALEFSDDASPTPGPGPGDVVRKRFITPGPGPHFMEHFGPALMHPGPGKTIKNAPYSAEAVNEYQQTLADGNQITSRRSTMNYRDSAGRMRHEVRDEQGAVRNVTIVDPNEGTTWVLRPEARTAVKIGPHRDIARLAADKARAHVEHMRTPDGDRMIVKRVEREAEREARKSLRDDIRRDAAARSEEIRIRIDKDMVARGAPMPGMDRIGPAIAGAFGDIKYSSKSTVKDLGTREIEGVKAQGKLRSYEIPAGEIGNRNPIVVSDERWYAPDLQVTVMTKHSDPRSGERTYRLSNIRRDEPAASLFAIPSDYTVKDTMAEVRKALEAGPGAARKQ